MEQQQKQLESIEKYLDGQLSEAEKVEFEKQLNRHKEFRIYFDEIKLIIEGVKSSARSELLRKLRKTETNLESFREAKTFHLKKYLAPISVAAGLVLLIGLSILLGQKKSEVKLENYLADAIEPYQNIIYPMQRRHVSILSTEQMAYYYYDAQ